MRIRTGLYVRTPIQGIFVISHINEIFDDNDFRKVCLCQNEEVAFTNVSSIKAIKHNYNIIKLIEENDYVNGKKITRVIPPDVCGDEELTYKRIFSDDEEIFEDDIETVLTKEQFENEAYKVV